MTKKKPELCYATGRPLKGRPAVTINIDGKDVGRVLLSEIKTAQMNSRAAEREE